MVRLLLPLLNLALMVYCLVDCVQTDASRVRNLPKPVWVLLIILLPLAGAVGWLVAGRAPRRPPPGQRPPAPRGPDDDPDFLRGLRDDPSGG